MERWLRRYRGDNDPPRGPDYLLTPLIVIAWLGLLWSLPVPRSFSESTPVLNWSTVFMMATVVYYFILSLPLAFGLLPFVLLAAVLLAVLDGSTAPLPQMAAVTLGAALAIQALRRSTGWRSIPRTVLFVMLGPPWLLAALYRRLRIPY